MRFQPSFLWLAWLLSALACVPALPVEAAPPAAVAEASAADLFPPELVEFTPYEANPIFVGAGPGHWDAAIRERGWIIREGNDWRLWYTGYDGTRAGRKLLGYATSQDGLHWKRYGDRPVFDQDWVEDMTVVHDDGVYYMFAEGVGDRAEWLTSPDGVNWQRQGSLDVRYTNGQPLSPGPFGTPTVWKENGVWHLLFERGDRGVWLAKSDDLKIWRQVQDEPVMTPNEQEHGAIAVNQVVKRHGRYYAYYHAIHDPQKRTWCTNLATSEDLLNWTRYPGNPIVDNNQSSGILIDDGQRWRLYTMHPEVRVLLGKPVADSSN